MHWELFYRKNTFELIILIRINFFKYIGTDFIQKLHWDWFYYKNILEMILQ